jgi:DNA-binding MarR family transcriptional regulator
VSATLSPTSPANVSPQHPRLTALRSSLLNMVADDAPDLNARQLAVLLTVQLDQAPHTVRGLAAKLRVNKPSITRALDRLSECDFARRSVDKADRRSVLISLTPSGRAFLARLGAGEEAAQ